MEDQYVKGILRQMVPFSISGIWNPASPSETHPNGDVSLTLRPIGPFKAYARVLFIGQVLMPDMFTIRDLIIVMPCHDRRVARRVARRSGFRFKKCVDGSYTFKKR